MLVYEISSFATKFSSCPRSTFRVCQQGIVGLGKANPLGDTGVPFPKENASTSHTVWHGSQSQEGLQGNGAGCGKSQLFPLVYCDLASTTDPFWDLLTAWEDQGNILSKLGRTAASCLTFNFEQNI